MSKKLIYLMFFTLVLGLADSASASLPEGWSSRDIGSPSAPGSASYNDFEGTWAISGDGHDIWGSSDAFRFTYIPLSGDGMIVARILDNGSGSDTWAKGGVMIRETLEANSKFAMMIITGGAGAGKAFQCRPNTGSYSYSSHGGSPVSPPMWVKLVREGNLFTGYYSVDGVDWQQQPDGTGWDATPNPIEINMNQDVYIGLCVTSVVPGEVRTYTFDNITTEMPSIALRPDPADGSIYEDTSASLYWIPGTYAASYDVCFGENFSNVRDGTGDTFQGNQTETYFLVGSPGHPYPNGLVPGTTYYWRVDGIGDDGKVYKGDIWSFTIQSVSPKYFEITYYDNYNYDTGRWDGWQSTETPRDAWDDKYLADDSSGKTVFTNHAFTSRAVFDLRGNLFSKDGHESWGEDWNPLKSIGDNVSGQSPHHVFAALFKGLVYLEEGDVLTVASDDDVYVFLDDNTRWGEEVLSIPNVSYFLTDSMTVTASKAGYHMMTVKFIERLNNHSGIEITLNGVPIRSVEVPRFEDFETGDFSKYSWMHSADSNWIISQREKYSGAYSAEAGAIGDNESTTLEITLDCVPGSITFYRKVSSESGFDYLKFYIDGEKKGAWSGEEDWVEMSFAVDEGVRTYEWTYSKDDSVSEGDDTAWIDDIVFPVKTSSPELPDNLEGFDIYLDDIAPDIIESSMISNGLLDFYYGRNTASGDFCIHWTGVDQYNNISFQFSPVKDLSKMVDEGYVVDFWVRCNSNVQFDIGFVDTKTDQEDHPWQNRFKIDRDVAVWDGSWNHLEIPLISFYMHGSWDNDRWYEPSSEFDWTATEYFLIVAEDGDLQRVDLFFDDIRLVHPRLAGRN